MALLLEDLHGVGNVFPGQAGQAQPLGLKMDGEQESQIVQQSGQYSRQHHLGIAEV